MTRSRSIPRPVLWAVFAVMVMVPSVQLTRYFRSRDGAPVQLAGFPRRASFRYDAIGPADAPIAAAAVSPGGRLVAVLDDSGRVAVWDLRARKRISSFASDQRLPMRDLQPSGTPIAVEEPVGVDLSLAMVAIGGNDGSVRVWSATTGEQILDVQHSFRDARDSTMEEAPLTDAEISLEGGLISVSRNGALAMWRYHTDPDSALVWMSRAPRGGAVRDAALSRDGRAIAVATTWGLYVMNPRPDMRRWTVVDSIGSPERVRFSPGGGIFAAIYPEGDVRIYSAMTLDRIKVMHFGTSGPGRTLAFSQDGEMLAASDGNRIIQVWSTGFGAPVALTAPHGPVRSLWFTADNKHVIVSAIGDRYLRSLPIPKTP